MKAFIRYVTGTPFSPATVQELELHNVDLGVSPESRAECYQLRHRLATEGWKIDEGRWITPAAILELRVEE